MSDLYSETRNESAGLPVENTPVSSESAPLTAPADASITLDDSPVDSPVDTPVEPVEAPETSDSAPVVAEADPAFVLNDEEAETPLEPEAVPELEPETVPALNPNARPFEDFRIEEGFETFLPAEIATPEQDKALYAALKQASAELTHPGDTATPGEFQNYQSRLVGRMNELLAQQTHGAEDLNAAVPNTPVYDLKAGDTYLSAKGYNVGDDAPNTANYAHALEVATGAAHAKAGKYDGMSGVDFAAGALAESQESTPEALAESMRQHGGIVIPADHVEPVQNRLRETLPAKMAEDPARYGLDLSDLDDAGANAAIQAKVEDYCARVKSTGFTAAQISAAVSRVAPFDTRKR